MKFKSGDVVCDKETGHVYVLEVKISSGKWRVGGSFSSDVKLESKLISAKVYESAVMRAIRGPATNLAFGAGVVKYSVVWTY